MATYHHKAASFFRSVCPPSHPSWIGVGEIAKRDNSQQPSSATLCHFLDTFFMNLSTCNFISTAILVLSCLLADRAVLSTPTLPSTEPRKSRGQLPNNELAIQRDLAVATVVVSAKLLDDCFGPDEYARIAQAARISRADVLCMETTFLSRWLCFDLWVDPLEFSLFTDKLEASGWIFSTPAPASPLDGLVRSPASYPRSLLESPTVLPPLQLCQINNTADNILTNTSASSCMIPSTGIATRNQNSIATPCRSLTALPSPTHIQHPSYSSPQLLPHLPLRTSANTYFTSQRFGTCTTVTPSAPNGASDFCQMKSPASSPCLSSYSSSAFPSLSPPTTSPQASRPSPSPTSVPGSSEIRPLPSDNFSPRPFLP
ncbi:hypothetical protein Pelo_3591 [Pelomyxa schiedti]|nr:hypothetical protein Pelo_3591 [Pelomyxa schiedti]